MGIVLGGSFQDENFPGGSPLGVNFSSGNCVGGSYPWWQFSLVGVFRVESSG